MDFWAWREEMFRVADGLDPDSYLELATAVYREMVLAGFTAVGEFHYLHHGPGGTPYSNPNAMSEALRHAAAMAGRPASSSAADAGSPSTRTASRARCRDKR